MQIKIKDKDGVVLKTSKKYCEEDIAVSAETKELRIIPSTEDQIYEGLFNKVIVAGDSDLLSENIKNGKSIFNVEGDFTPLDTSDATATEEDILLGKTAYVNGEKIVGTLESGALDSAYQQIEYLESNGTQYIDTGVCPVSSSLSAVVEFKPCSLPLGHEHWAFGQWYGSGGWRCGGSTSSSTANFNLDTSRGFSYAITSGSSTRLYRNIGMSVSCTITSDYPMLLFAQQEGGNAGYVEYSQFKIYRCMIWKDRELIRDFIPCYRKSDGEAGMYDIVNNVFYTNNGTGTFITGPVKV
ncbi:MAG: hypothetical protein ACI4U9_01600 [Clostridia bacterium]